MLQKGYWSAFGTLQGVEDGATFFSTLERQSVVLHLLHSLRAVQGEAVEGTTFREGQAISRSPSVILYLFLSHFTCLSKVTWQISYSYAFFLAGCLQLYVTAFKFYITFSVWVVCEYRSHSNNILHDVGITKHVSIIVCPQYAPFRMEFTTGDEDGKALIIHDSLRAQ